jgi:hypothetical protein
MGERTPVEELNQKIAEYALEHALTQPRPLTEEGFARVRERRGEMFAKWEAVLPGDALEIPFEVAQANLHQSQH